MKKIAVCLMILSITPFVSSAQTTTVSSDGSNEPAYVRRERIRGWRGQSSELQQKINALGTTAVISVPMPVLFGVTLKNIFPNFGDPRDGGARTHEGEDIMAVKGTPVVSPTPAVVLRTGVGATEGNYVYTANPGGETFVYMHLDKIGEGVISGTVLETGSLIGYVGNTGNASGGAAHLHFEIFTGNRDHVDPFPRLTKEFTIEEKIAYLSKIVSQASDPTQLSAFLVKNFRSTFTGAISKGIVLPLSINVALNSGGQSGTSSSKSSVTRDLKKGMSGEDVRTLQKFLNGHGFTVASSGAGSSGNETTYFGPATLASVIKFQLANKISPSVGYVGPLTRAVISLL